MWHFDSRCCARKVCVFALPGWRVCQRCWSCSAKLLMTVCRNRTWQKHSVELKDSWLSLREDKTLAVHMRECVSMPFKRIVHSIKILKHRPSCRYKPERLAFVRRTQNQKCIRMFTLLISIQWIINKRSYMFNAHRWFRILHCNVYAHP